MKVVVTGASGNVGTAVLQRLAHREDPPEVVAVARRTPPARGPYATATWVRVDVAEPDAAERLRPVMDGADAVVHLAWGFQPSHRREYLRRTAVDGTRAVVTAAVAAGVPHVVHMSSGAVYAPGSYGRAVDESWPVGGVPRCDYSADKVAVERMLDTVALPEVFTRLRPGFIGQHAAGPGLERYVLPDVLPAAIVDHLPLLPLDRSMAIPAIHADDVAAAIDAILDRRTGGVFNLAAPTPVSASDFAAPFDCGTAPVPWKILAAAADLTWRMRLQPVQGGWVELAYATPMLDTTRAADLLDWSPRMDGPEVWAETVAGMRARPKSDSPVLHTRSGRERCAVLVERGGIARRVPS